MHNVFWMTTKAHDCLILLEFKIADTTNLGLLGHRKSDHATLQVLVHLRRKFSQHVILRFGICWDNSSLLCVLCICNNQGKTTVVGQFAGTHNVIFKISAVRKFVLDVVEANYRIFKLLL